MRGILRDNGFEKDRYQTSDFFKLFEPMRLGEYTVEFSEIPWLGTFSPFSDWKNTAPTQSLPWYDAYNASKHDRTTNLHRASLRSVFDALAAIWVLLSAQYGPSSWRTHSGSDRTFKCVACPRWRYSDLYTYPYEGAGPGGEKILLFPSV